MSQALLCLVAAKKVQSRKRDFGNGILRATYLLARAGWSSRFSPPSATSARSPMRRGRLTHAAAIVAGAMPRRADAGCAGFYSCREGIGCRDGLSGRDGASGCRPGSGARDGSGERLRLTSHLRRSAPCR